MKCENLQLNLPLYLDDILSGAERAAVEEHLQRCPLCRARLADFQSLRNDLHKLSRPALPNDLMYSVKTSVAAELKKTNRQPSFIFSTGFREWLQYRVMPYGVGIAVSFVLTFSLLLTLLSTKEATQKGVEIAKVNSNRSAILLAANNNPRMDEAAGPDFPALNLPISDESPSLNPAGALLALTKSIVRGKMKDEEVVVVADVFGDGIAKIAEVVEAPRDRRAMKDLEKALNDDPNYAPFVPANQDKRSGVIRVILKIQRVDVVERSSPKIKSRNR